MMFKGFDGEFLNVWIGFGFWYRLQWHGQNWFPYYCKEMCHTHKTNRPNKIRCCTWSWKTLISLSWEKIISLISIFFTSPFSPTMLITLLQVISPIRPDRNDHVCRCKCAVSTSHNALLFLWVLELEADLHSCTHSPVSFSPLTRLLLYVTRYNKT